MKINKKIIIAICLVGIISVGCSKNSEENNKDLSIQNIENHIPYIGENNSQIDNDIINERYENVKKEELTYDIQEYKKENSYDNYKNILRGFTYSSEINPINLTYDEAIELVKKVLPDDIKQVDLKVDEDINKEYIYYQSSKGNFRVGLCYVYEFNDENVQVVNKDRICGIDYSIEIK